MNPQIENTIKILKENKQENLLNLFDKMQEIDKIRISKQISKINFKEINELYKKAHETPEIIEKKIEHIDYVDASKLSNVEIIKYQKIGENIIKKNEYAVVTMAGGQGTRLGHEGPKGTFRLEVSPKPKFLFEIIADNLIDVNQKYNIILPWYIMTSNENNRETVEFFEKYNYFGYNKDYIKFFSQDDLPLILMNGDLVINEDYSVKFASNGNGSIYKAMKKNGILDDMEARGIKWIFIGAVDNALLNMVDPVLLGLTISEENEAASKSIAKKNPNEKVGVFCRANGVPSVIEYSELPTEMAEMRDKEGELLYGEAHIMCNLFSLNALKKVANENLEYHIACKKTDYMDKNGVYIHSTVPNAYKFEAFIFDAFNYFDNITILRGKREENFAPVKNRKDEDSPETAIKLYNDYWKRMSSQSKETVVTKELVGQA